MGTGGRVSNASGSFVNPELEEIDGLPDLLQGQGRSPMTVKKAK